ncbi:MAG TPA: hypothetical protein VFV54_04830 [Thermoanaerobaculia bacterium]|nr:hypothetical protein [Thermoanaerobaculia bacterium]
MNFSANVSVALAATLLAAACASTPQPVSTDPTDAAADKSLRVLGRDNDVRIEARVLTNEFRQSSLVAISYDIENLRGEPIVFAALEPTVDYEPSSRTLTLSLGTEIPLQQAFPRLVRIAAGERRTFTSGARISVPSGSAMRSGPRYLQVRFNYLDGVGPFEPLIANGSLAPADEEGLFRSWVDHIAAVVTNALPIRWGGSERTLTGSAAERAPAAIH